MRVSAAKLRAARRGTRWGVRSMAVVAKEKGPTDESVTVPAPRGRRGAMAGAGAALVAVGWGIAWGAGQADAGEILEMPGLAGVQGRQGGYGKTRMEYKDYTETKSGLLYFDYREGEGDLPKKGQRCVIDWAGFTLGYYGRPFETKLRAKGGAFENDKDYFRFILGDGAVIPAFEEMVAGMKPGGYRRIVVSPGPLSYQGQGWQSSLGPGPSTFSGRRALDFVLGNQGMIDKTLLFDIELMRVDDGSTVDTKGESFFGLT